MIPDDLLPHLVEVEHPGRTTDRYGNEVDDWSASTRAAVMAWMQQNAGAEDLDQRSAQIGEWLMLCNPWTTGAIRSPCTARTESTGTGSSSR